MAWQFFKIILAGTLISFTSWLSGRHPRLAGFLLALPVSTLLALAFSQVEFRDPATSVAFARSVFYAVPASLLFFVPFLFAEKIGLSFWALYAAGIALLVAGYFIHRAILGG